VDDRRRAVRRGGARVGAVVVAVLVTAGACTGDDDGPGPGETLPTVDGAVPTQATTLPDPQLEPADPVGGDTTVTVLGDGDWYAYLQLVDPSLGVVVVDVVEVLTGTAAAEAAAADGAPVPTGPYVHDDEPGVGVDVSLAPTVVVSVLGPDGSTLPFGLDQLAAAFAEAAPVELVGFTTTPYLLTVRDGVLVSLTQQPPPA
jgi:hypothetical protein